VLQPKDWDFLGEQKTTVLGNLWKGVRTMAALPALIAFAKRHCPLKVHPIMEALIGHLRGKEGQTKVGTIGFCFGGKFAITMAATDKIDASVAAHPSFVQVPADIDAIARPILFVCAEHDDVFTKANVAATKKIAAEKAAKGAVFEVKEYAGVAHGFAMRGDDSVPVQRDAREKAFADGLAFFNKQLA
jgi:dienelactone hydrolase